MICSCTIQHLDDETRTYFDIDLGESTELLTKRYLDICHGLSALIPPGHCHILNIKRLLHTIYWYKAEATFDKAWHLIGAAIREAQELGMQPGNPEHEVVANANSFARLSSDFGIRIVAGF
jgi:hypothetical protein